MDLTLTACRNLETQSVFCRLVLLAISGSDDTEREKDD